MSDESEFWKRHEKSCAAKVRKDEICSKVKCAIDDLVREYSDDEFDARRDIAWYFEQLGKDLRSDLDKEKAAERALQNAK